MFFRPPAALSNVATNDPKTHYPMQWLYTKKTSLRRRRGDTLWNMISCLKWSYYNDTPKIPKSNDAFPDEIYRAAQVNPCVSAYFLTLCFVQAAYCSATPGFKSLFSLTVPTHSCPLAIAAKTELPQVFKNVLPRSFSKQHEELLSKVVCHLAGHCTLHQTAEWVDQPLRRSVILLVKKLILYLT